MGKKSFKTAVLSGIAMIAAVVMSVSSTTTTFAVGCSGTGCNGRDPVSTGCNQNAYLAARVSFKDNYGIVLNPFSKSTPYLNVYYSRSCGTNWLQVTSNPYGGNAYKEIQVLNTNGTTGFLEMESDWGYGSSYSMMVYAPGSTAVRVWSKLTNTANVTQARTSVTTVY